jgi:hypothetical protein
VKKNIVIATAVILGFVGIISTFLITTTQSQTTEIQKSEDDIPTEVQKGKFTEKQRKQSKRYEEESLAVSQPLTKIKDATVYISVNSGPILLTENTQTRFDVLQKMSCRSDAVVKGKIETKNSQLTENEKLIFTDYEVSISEIVKNVSLLNLDQIGKLTLIAKGGSVRMKNKVMKVIVERDLPLQVGSEYIFLLRYLPETDSYELISERGYFGVSGEKIKVGRNTNGNDAESLSNFLELLRQVNLTNCEKMTEK